MARFRSSTARARSRSQKSLKIFVRPRQATTGRPRCSRGGRGGAGEEGWAVACVMNPPGSAAVHNPPLGVDLHLLLAHAPVALLGRLQVRPQTHLTLNLSAQLGI